MSPDFNINDIKKGPIRGPLSPELLARIHAYKALLGDADELSLEETIDNFMRDEYPEQEVAIHESVAHAYDKLIRENPELSLEARRNLYLRLMLRTMIA